MKKTNILMTLVLLFAASVSLQAQNYTVKQRVGLQDANVNGSVSATPQNPKAGTTVVVTCTPNGGFGLVRGVFYAVKDANGEYGETKMAKNTSEYKEDLANPQKFTFTMPHGNVEIWAYFDSTRVMVIHDAPEGKLEPVYGRREHKPTNEVYNVPLHPVKLKVVPNDNLHELVDVKFNFNMAGHHKKTTDTVTVLMPSRMDTLHITPVFGKKNYQVTVNAQNVPQIKVKLSSEAPKAYEEVEAVLESEKNYIPIDVSITGCLSSWRVGKPQRKDDGGWKTVYRFKVGLQDVAIHFKQQQVYAFTVSETGKSGRVETLIPEMYPGYPGVASNGQEVPVLFMMPANFSANYTATGVSSPLVYHNKLKNSFADNGMSYWNESDSFQGLGQRMKVDTDTDGNKYWSTGVHNLMSQSVSISGRQFPANAFRDVQIDKTHTDKRLSVATIASINPRNARSVQIGVATSRDNVSDTIIVGELKNKDDGWQTYFKTVGVKPDAETLSFVVSSIADDLTKTRSYAGPQFDDLCLLLPVDRTSVQNEDVLVFNMGEQDVTINYTPTGEQNKASVAQKGHASLTLLNKTTGEEGESVKMMENDVIVITGKYDEGYAIYDIDRQPLKPTGEADGEREFMDPDSVNLASNTIYYHYLVDKAQDVSFIPTVDKLMVKVENNYGGEIKVDNENAKKGEKVIVTVTPNAGCTFKQINTIPAGIATFKAENVDALTGAGTYSFEMTSSYIKLQPEFAVPIATAEDLAQIDLQRGEFVLTADLDLGDNWDKDIMVSGYLNGNGHRITYGGERSLFSYVTSSGVVRHLYVKANVHGELTEVGGITSNNNGIIEDCEVRGTLKSSYSSSVVGGVVGKNIPDGKGGVISRCHVICDAIDGLDVYGIAKLSAGSVIKNNVFNGKFADGDNQAFMICNDMNNCTIEGNYYVTNSGNTRAKPYSGMSAAERKDLVDVIKNTPDDCPVFAASLRSLYDGGYWINLALVPEVVELVNKSSERAAAGTEFTASVRVIGNEHLESITISAADGSKPQNCPFTDNEDNVYFFSFNMPDHDVLVTFKTADGRFIYTPRQFIAVNEVQGTFYLARDIDLNDWEREVNLGMGSKFYGMGHTIRYHGTTKCKGLFHQIKSGALLEGLRVIGYVETKNSCGGIAYSNAGTIRNCHFSGSIKKQLVMSQRKKVLDCVSAIACEVDLDGGKLDHCSATAELICSGNEDNQKAVNAHPLCFQSDVNVDACKWVHPTETDKYNDLLAEAEKQREAYPVYAQGILDKINPRVITGSKTIRVENGKTLDELTIVDGEPFQVTADVKVKRIVYKRQATNGLEQWILPFDFDRIAGSGSFECHAMEVKKMMPAVGTTIADLKLSNTPEVISYKTKTPWLVKCEGGEYVLTNANGPITIKATGYNRIDQHVSLQSRSNLYATGDSISAKIAKEGLMYVWDVKKQGFFCSDSVGILPNRFYAQYYNNKNKQFVKYAQTEFPNQRQMASNRSNPVASQRLGAAVADGWQPVFLDPREPQSVTARMLDYYEVAYLSDVYIEAVDEQAESPVSIVSMVYQMVNDRMELPTAIPLLVRAKRGDAEPLVNEQMGAEVDALILESLLDEDDEETEDDFEMPDYWCGTLRNRLDIWHLPSSESYADLAEFGCLLFNDNRLEQTFNYATATDSRTTAPMSYCLTVLNTDTYELLPLMSDRVYVEFVGTSEATGISLTPNPSPIGEGNTPMYNLSGQRVGASYKGIILQNGRKIYKK